MIINKFRPFSRMFPYCFMGKLPTSTLITQATFSLSAIFSIHPPILFLSLPIQHHSIILLFLFYLLILLNFYVISGPSSLQSCRRGKVRTRRISRGHWAGWMAAPHPCTAWYSFCRFLSKSLRPCSYTTRSSSGLRTRWSPTGMPGHRPTCAFCTHRFEPSALLWLRGSYSFSGFVSLGPGQI